MVGYGSRQYRDREGAALVCDSSWGQFDGSGVERKTDAALKGGLSSCEADRGTAHRAEELEQVVC